MQLDNIYRSGNKRKIVLHSVSRFLHSDKSYVYVHSMEKPYCKKLLQVERMSHFLAEIMSLTKSLFCFVSCRPLFGEVQLINPSRAALVPVLPLSPENSQNNIANAPHPGDIHPAYRIPYMQLLHTLHSATSPQSSLHGE